MTARAKSRPAIEARRLVAALDAILAWLERARQRAQLASLDPHALHDLGLSSADVAREYAKRFWQR